MLRARCNLKVHDNFNMAIKFMLDPLKDEDKNVLKKVIETANKKPIYRNREALFLKNFVLALFKQYKFKEKYEHKIKIERFNLPYFGTEAKINGNKPINVKMMPSNAMNVPRPIELQVNIVPKPVEILPDIPVPI